MVKTVSFYHATALSHSYTGLSLAPFMGRPRPSFGSPLMGWPGLRRRPYIKSRTLEATTFFLESPSSAPCCGSAPPESFGLYLLQGSVSSRVFILPRATSLLSCLMMR